MALMSPEELNTAVYRKELSEDIKQRIYQLQDDLVNLLDIISTIQDDLPEETKQYLERALKRYDDITVESVIAQECRNV